jgi:Zn-dependent metalloprotease
MPTSLHAIQAGAPHYLADLANHFFYLLSEGAVVPKGFGPGTAANLTPEALVANGDTALVGIGNTKAFGIWHHALTAHFSATVSFVQAGMAFSAAACELYGAESPEHRAVVAAWKAVKTR